jgi:uncharacterized protein (TIGR02147 family)
MYMSQDYRTYLKEVFVDRKRRNPSYSMRGFARDLGLPASRVSDLLGNKRHLSCRSAARVAKSLQLNEAEAAHFLASVASRQRGASQSTQSIYGIDHDYASETLTLDLFAVVSDWFHYAILELFETETFEADPAWIAKRLGISKIEVQLALVRLEKVGMLELAPDGQLKVTKSHSISSSDIPSEAIRKHHRQLMNKADLALDGVPLEQREVSTTIFSLDERDLPQAKKLLRQFRMELAALMTKRKKKNRVYSLGMQFIPLDKMNGRDL